MKFRDIFLVVLIRHFLYMLVSFLIVGFNNIKNNWVQYRCNPMITPFAVFLATIQLIILLNVLQLQTERSFHQLHWLLPLEEYNKIYQHYQTNFQV